MMPIVVRALVGWPGQTHEVFGVGRFGMDVVDVGAKVLVRVGKAAREDAQDEISVAGTHNGREVIAVADRHTGQRFFAVGSTCGDANQLATRA